MYKVFFNERFVLLTDKIGSLNLKGNVLYIEYWNKSSINILIDRFNKNKTIDKLVIYYHDLNELWFVFQSCFYFIEAAGGFIKNQHEEILLMKRNNMWDLPKGKLEKNELPKLAAIREVSEECGIHNHEIVNTLNPTYHTFLINDEKMLKKTYWYEMKYSGNEKLVPQIEEGITDVVWVKQDEIEIYFPKMYKSIIEVIKEASHKK
ncbi:MAG: hypothetical protein A2W98_08995 [Bacteroidetes bacterium GWF2_33_38]|nr:MAG: hypothetical protein A2W98_08995 [Bacteroidetes bacterium GWF2_33_38]OFY90133.1 MAG: hypothetical protein A2236_10155 [Bacteroidetes bacterium RIFOXYA2_FULL_33_7]